MGCFMQIAKNINLEKSEIKDEQPCRFEGVDIAQVNQ